MRTLFSQKWSCQISLALVAIFVVHCADNRAVAEYEIDVDAGLWIPFLPDYTAGSIVQGGVVQQPDLFRDDQTDLGTKLGLSGFYRLPDAERRLEYDFGLAGIGSMGSTATFADPNPGSVWFASLDGIGRIQTAAGENATFSFDSDVLFNSQYVGIGNTRYVHGDGSRPIDIGIGFSHLEFEQEFVMNARINTGDNGQYLEDLDTNFLGGEIRTSMARRLNGRDWIFDFNVGLFNMDAEYVGQSYLRNIGGAVLDFDRITDQLDEFAVTVDAAVRLDTKIYGVAVRPGVTFKYISDMPFINHPMTEVPISDPAFISTESGYFLGINVEMFLLGGCCP